MRAIMAHSEGTGTLKRNRIELCYLIINTVYSFLRN